MLDLSILFAFAFCAGMVDAVVGGGGLIQIPALINAFPDAPVATLFGTNKLASICGTSVAARTYIGRVHIPWRLVLPAAASAFAMSFLGAATVSFVPQSWLRPVVLVLIVSMAFYIFHKKDFGTIQRAMHIGTRERVLSVLIGGGIGFYDGLFGPGTGSFLIFLFVRYFAFDFLQASASAEFVNSPPTWRHSCSSFLPATCSTRSLFPPPYSTCWVPTLAPGRAETGAGFVRVLFLCLLAVLILKLGYDMVTA